MEREKCLLGVLEKAIYKKFKIRLLEQKNITNSKHYFEEWIYGFRKASATIGNIRMCWLDAFLCC